MRDEAALLPAPDHGLDVVIGHVEQRALARAAVVGRGCGQVTMIVTMVVAMMVVMVLRRSCGLAGHESPVCPGRHQAARRLSRIRDSLWGAVENMDGGKTSTRRHMRRTR